MLRAVLLIALWVRSYLAWDSPNGPFFGNRWIQFNSLRGHLFVSILDAKETWNSAIGIFGCFEQMA